MILEASIKSLEKVGKRIVIKALAVTDKYISPDIIDSIVKYSPNQPMIYRHVHPSSPGEGEILGNVIKAEKVEVDKNVGIEITSEFMDYTPYQQTAVKYVTEKQEAGDPIKISIGLQEYSVDGKSIDARPFEYSLTHIPVCKECATKEVLVMEEKEKEKKDSEAVIAELRKTLDETVKKNQELTSKLTKFEDAGAKIEKEVASIAENVRKEYDDKLKAMQTKLENVEKELDMSKRMPVINEIYKYEKSDFLKGIYMTQKLEDLQAHLTELRKKEPPALVTSTMEESRAAATDKSLEEKLLAEVRNRMKEDPELNKIFNGPGLSDAERGVASW
jgi:paraquat-inducible protein B